MDTGSKKIARVFPRRTSATPHDELAFVGGYNDGDDRSHSESGAVGNPYIRNIYVGFAGCG